MWKFFTNAGALKTASGTAELSYVEVTGNYTTVATTEGTATAIATSAAVTYDGVTPVYIEFFAPIVRPQGTAAASMVFWLYQDGTSIGQLAQVTTPAANVMDVPIAIKRKMTPTSGSHTYSIRGSTTSGTGSLFAGAGGAGVTMPAYIRISRAN